MKLPLSLGSLSTFRECGACTATINSTRKLGSIIFLQSRIQKFWTKLLLFRRTLNLKSKGSFGKFIGKENYSFKLKIRKEKTDYIRMYKWANDQKFEEQSDGTAIMTFTSNQYYLVLNWILEKGMYVTPLAPQKLVNDWRENVLAMYEEVKNG